METGTIRDFTVSFGEAPKWDTIVYTARRNFINASNSGRRCMGGCAQVKEFCTFTILSPARRQAVRRGDAQTKLCRGLKKAMICPDFERDEDPSQMGRHAAGLYQ